MSHTSINLALLGSVLLAGMAPSAAAQTSPTNPAARPAAAAPKPDPALEAAQRAFDALPEIERKAIQDDLIWASDFTATISGSFGKRTYDAILAFERAARSSTDGILDSNERRQLAAEAQKARLAAKFAPVIDARTGARLGVPAAALPKRDVLATGTRWSSPDGAVVLETAVAAGGTAELPAAFERLMAVQAPGRKVTYKLLRPDFFVVSGENGPRSFYTRYGIGATALAGYTLSYPTAQAKQVERILIAVANSFQPVPAHAGGIASAISPSTQPGQPPVLQPAAEAVLPAGLFQTGIIVAPGKVVTAGLAEACQDITINRKPARISGSDKTARLVLLDADTGAARPVSLAAANGESPDVVIIGFGGPPTVLSVSTGHRLASDAGASSFRMEATLPRESGGSAVFNRNGALAGLIASPARGPRLVAGLAPAVSQTVSTVATIAKFAGLALAPARAETPQMTAGSIAALAAGSLVAVECAKPVPLPKS